MFATSKQLIVWFLLLVAVGLVSYSPGIGTQYYADDFAFVLDTSSFEGLYRYFYENVPRVDFYRPFQTSFLWINQRLFGLNTAPIHIVQIVLHSLLSALVFVVIRFLGFSGRQTVLGSLFMMISQANVFAVLSNDTVSQILCTLYGFMSVCLLYRYLFTRGSRETTARRRRGYVLSVTCLALSCLSKESGVAYFGIIVVLLLLSRLNSTGSISTKKTLLLCLPYFLVISSYLVLRTAVAARQPAFGADWYDFNAGTNILVNAASFLFAAAIPASSVDAYVALKSGDTVMSALFLGTTAAFVLLAGIGLVLSPGRHKLFLLFGMCAVISWFPIILLNHISELYVYNAMPFVSILVGVGLGRVLHLVAKHRLSRWSIAVAISLIVTTHVLAVRDKAALMHSAGESSDGLIRQINNYVQFVPDGGGVLLVNPQCPDVEYSIYRYNGFNVLRPCFYRINQVSGKRNLTVKLVEEGSIPYETAGTSEHWVSVTLDGENVIRLCLK